MNQLKEKPDAFSRGYEQQEQQDTRWWVCCGWFYALVLLAAAIYCVWLRWRQA